MGMASLFTDLWLFCPETGACPGQLTIIFFFDERCLLVIYLNLLQCKLSIGPNFT
jgi:hypothetical protein